MKKILFPEWSPKDLIETFNRMKSENESYRQWHSELDRDDTGVHSFENWDTKAAEKDRLADLLCSLLTDPNMESAWSTLFFHPPLDSNPFRKEPASSLWIAISVALEYFKVFISIQLTTAQKSKNLKSISSKTKALLNAISKDPFAVEIAKKTVTSYLWKRNIEWRESEGETPPWYEYDMPMTLNSDCDEAWTEIRHKSLMTDFYDEAEDKYNYEWKKEHLLVRLGHWLKETEELNLIDLLEFFVNIVEIETKLPLEIKHPGRGESALRPFLIRRINAHMQWYYGQPLDDAVAQIVTTILELSTPLTRDDVRPYIIDSGKILDQSN
jgi:hypothetical protein